MYEWNITLKINVFYIQDMECSSKMIRTNITVSLTFLSACIHHVMMYAIIDYVKTHVRRLTFRALNMQLNNVEIICHLLVLD